MPKVANAATDTARIIKPDIEPRDLPDEFRIPPSLKVKADFIVPPLQDEEGNVVNARRFSPTKPPPPSPVEFEEPPDLGLGLINVSVLTVPRLVMLPLVLGSPEGKQHAAKLEAKLRPFPEAQKAEPAAEAMIILFSLGIGMAAGADIALSRAAQALDDVAATPLRLTRPRMLTPGTGFEPVPPARTAFAPVTPKGTRMEVVVRFNYTPAKAAEPTSANFFRSAIESGHEQGLLRTASRHPLDDLARRYARMQMRQRGVNISNRQASHAVDSALNPHFDPNTGVYYFAHRSVNASFGSDVGGLGSYVISVPVRPYFTGFPSYDIVPPLAPPSSSFIH